MQITSITKIAPSVPEWANAPNQPRPAPSTASSPSSSASVGAAPAATSAHGSATTVRVVALAGTHSATVGGVSYPLSIEKAGATFVASVPNPPGATATGSSAQAAENNLNIKLDTLA